MSLQDAFAQMKNGALRRNEIPVGHYLSLPVPTLRFRRPAFAFFAAPAIHQPGQSAQALVPDRWWAVDAATKRLVVYAMDFAMPLVSIPATDDSVADAPDVDIAMLEEALRNAVSLLDEAGARFFAGAPASAAVAEQLGRDIALLTPPVLRSFYESIAPDFFAWLRDPQ